VIVLNPEAENCAGGGVPERSGASICYIDRRTSSEPGPRGWRL